MAEQTREERLAADLEALRALKKVSTIFDFEASSELPDRYTVSFRGKGVKQAPNPRGDVELIELHKCDIRLPYAYPKRPPDIRWLTPIFHPNISFSGFLNIREIGLPWEQDMSLEIVCERLWDVARLAYLNLDNAANYSAKSYYEQSCPLRLPVDQRPLRDRAGSGGRNIIGYTRRETAEPLAEGAGSLLHVELDLAAETDEVFFIGEDTAPPRREDESGDDVLYIGF